MNISKTRIRQLLGALCTLFAIAGLAPTPLRAATYTWDAGGAGGVTDGGGTWNSTTPAHWWNGSSDVAWPNNAVGGNTDVAVFGNNNGAAGTATIGTTINLNGITFNPAGSGNYTLSGGTLDFGGAGPAIAVNTSGTTTISTTTISSQGSSPLALTVASGDALTLASTAWSSMGTSGITINGNGTVNVTGGNAAGGQFGVGSAYAGTLVVQSGTTNVSATTLTIGGSGASTPVFNQTGGVFNFTDGGSGIALSSNAQPSVISISGGVFNQLGAAGLIELGVSSSGTLNISNTGTMNLIGQFDVGNGAASTINISGGALNMSTNSLALGIAHSGAVNLSGSGVFASTTTGGISYIGYSANSTWTQTGGSASFANQINTGQAGGNNSIVVSGGTFTQTSGNLYLAISGTTTLTVSGNGLVNLAGSLIDSYNGAAVVNLNGGTLKTGSISTNAGNSTLNFNGGTLQAGASSTTFLQGLTNASVLGGGAIIDTNGFNDTIAQALLSGTANDGGLTKLGSGTLTLSASNTYGGGVAINAGALNYGSVYVLGAGTATFTGNSTLQAGVSGTVANAIAINPSVTGTLDTQAFSETLGGNVSGTGALAKIGSGTLTLGGNNSGLQGSYINTAGNTYFNAATAGSGSAAWVINAGTVANNIPTAINATPTISLGALSGSAGGTLGNNVGGSTATYLIGALGTSSTYSGVISNGSGVTAITETGTGLLTLTGANTYSGGTTINPGATLQIGNGGSAGSILSTGTITDNGNLVYNYNSSTSVTMPSGGLISGSGNLSATAQVIGLSGTIAVGGSQTYTELIGGGGAYKGMLISANATLTGSSISMTGDVGNNTGGTAYVLALDTSATNGPISLNVSLGRPSVWYSLAGLTANSGTGTLSVIGTGPNSNGWSGTPVTLTGAVNISAPVNDNSTLTINPTTATASSVSGTLSGGMSLVAGGPGTLTLTASNTYSGNTTVNGGTLQIGNGSTGSLSNSSALSVSGGATLAFNEANGASQTQNIADAGTVAGVEGSGITNTLGGIISGTGAFTQSSAGITILTNANTYSGGTTINPGATLQIGNGGSTGSILSTGTITDNGNLVYNLNSTTAVNIPFGTAISGSGSLSVTAGGGGSGAPYDYIGLGGNVNLGGSQSYIESGSNAGANVYEGISVGASLTLTGSSITMSGDVGRSGGPGGYTLALNTSATNGPINLNVSLGRANVWYQLAGLTANSGTGAINVLGTGPQSSGWTATPVTLTGAVNISAPVNDSSTLTINPTTATASSVSAALSGGMSLVVGGPGMLVLSASNGYTGSTTVNAGTLIVSGSISGTSVVNVASGATLEADGLVNTGAIVSATGGTIQGVGNLGAVNMAGGATLAPGFETSGPVASGKLSAGNVVFTDTGSAFSIALGVTSGSDSTVLASIGTVTLDKTPLQLTLGSAINNPANLGLVYVIINGGAGSTGSSSDLFSYGGNTIANGASFTTGGFTFQVLYAENAAGTGSGSDVDLQLTAIPEPQTWAEIALGFGLLIGLQRSRRRQARVK